MQLRPYQADMNAKARGHFRAGTKRVLLQLATGGGKTAMALHMMLGAAARGLRCHFNVHRKELIDQTSRAFTAGGLGHGFIASGWPMDQRQLISLNGVATLAKRLDACLEPELCVWDEAHHMAARTWRDIFDRWPNAYHIGLSATPERLDGQGLRDFFDVMVSGPSTAALIEMGFLSPYQYFAPGEPDLVGMRRTAGDFNRGDLSELMDKPKLIGDAVEHYLRLARGEQGIFFAVDRQHSRHQAEAFAAEGVRTAHIDGSMDDKERARLMAAFWARDLDMLCNVDLFGEGLDAPGLVYVGMGRPTDSLSLFRQQAGRALRIFDGKECAVICDHAGNAFRHGLPDSPVTWSLDGRKVRKAAAGDSGPGIHQCPECFRITYSQTRLCPCGYEFTTRERSLAWENGQLFELKAVDAKAKAKEEATKLRKAEERAAETLEQLVELGHRRGYDKPLAWAKMKIEQRSGAFFSRRRRFG